MKQASHNVSKQAIKGLPSEAGRAGLAQSHPAAPMPQAPKQAQADARSVRMQPRMPMTRASAPMDCQSERATSGRVAPCVSEQGGALARRDLAAERQLARVAANVEALRREDASLDRAIGETLERETAAERAALDRATEALHAKTRAVLDRADIQEKQERQQELHDELQQMMFAVQTEVRRRARAIQRDASLSPQQKSAEIASINAAVENALIGDDERALMQGLCSLLGGIAAPSGHARVLRLHMPYPV